MMRDLIILNSNMRVMITLQNWTMDTLTPFTNALYQKGFNIGQTPQQIAMKGTTSNIQIDYPNRRISIYITNNITSPNENVEEILSALSHIGYPSEESVSRIDIGGDISIKIQNESSSSLVSNIVQNKFIDNVGEIFERKMKAIGIRISSSESFTNHISTSPFVILFEPLFTDNSDTKMLAQLIYMSDNIRYSLQFLKGLYDRLKNTVMVLKHE
jgi:hypothetical protein